ncbi:hypothetical protein DKX38_019468 [Salix brachista]|uniref:Uncharacterized protein n=1 Tax=Salix brachista TaxID=2182728 RepID=A0A5N5KGC9_9ROSI|nr:hypothetical protein DKX38_019468 [Salix brachista]
MANNVARAIVAALDWNSTPDARKAAVSFLGSAAGYQDTMQLHALQRHALAAGYQDTMQLHALQRHALVILQSAICNNFQWLKVIKTGDVRILASTSFVLVRRDWSSEILFVDVVLRSKGTDFIHVDVSAPSRKKKNAGDTREPSKLPAGKDKSRDTRLKGKKSMA